MEKKMEGELKEVADLQISNVELVLLSTFHLLQ
jgi:hypothetical protein